MPAAVEFRASVIGRINDLLKIELLKRGDEQVTPRQLRVAVMEDCKKVAEPYYVELLEQRVDQQAGWVLQRMRPAKAEAVPMLIPGLVLPYRIPVPTAGSVADEATQRWIVLHKATVGELRKHKLAVEHEVSTRTKYLDGIVLLFATVEPRCNGDDDRVVGELLRDADMIAPTA